MSKYEWKASYSTGNVKVDDQHRQLLQFANLFFEAIDQRKEAAILRNSFDLLVNYTREHFRDEEAYYRSIDSRKLDEQAKEHKQLESEVQAIQGLWENQVPGFDEKVASALENWLETRLLPHLFHLDHEAVRPGP